MAKNTVNDIEADLADSLQNELTTDLIEKLERASATTRMPLNENPFDQVSRLPRHIAGGFAGVGHDLDRKARDWRNIVRLLEQQRPQLEAAEAERDRLYEAFSHIAPEVQESGSAFKATLQATKEGDVSGDLAAHFMRSLNALDELESIAEALMTNMLAIRSAWEQYAKTMIKAQRMREELGAAASSAGKASKVSH
jgi:hypothetical protein